MTDIGNAKYMIRVNVKLDGQGQRKDIIGAIFGQTEGLMPEALDLRKLQRSGRIGHIDVTHRDTLNPGERGERHHRCRAGDNRAHRAGEGEPQGDRDHQHPLRQAAGDG